MLRFLFFFALFAFPFSVFVQNNDEAVKEKLRQETALLEQILTNADSMFASAL